jgi:heptaprenyl diphosphate synthase
MTQRERDTEIRKIALLVSCATILQILESLFPHPIPGIRLGLANMITLVALVDLGFRAALEIALMRTLISSFILGTFLSPPFILSFGAALSSTLVMGILYRLTTIRGRAFLSLVGISMIGAMVHNLAQIGLAYFLIIHHRSIFYLVPLLGISAVITGVITGLVASQVCMKLASSSGGGPETRGILDGTADVLSQAQGSTLQMRRYVRISSPVHATPASVKILASLAIATAVFMLHGFTGLSVVLLALLSAGLLSRVPFPRLLSDLGRLAPFLLFSFLISLFFMRDGRVIFSRGPFMLTETGLVTGGVIVYRLMLLMLSASILIATTSPDELAAALKKLLAPLKRVGVPADRLVTILTMSWLSIPAFWDRIHRYVTNKRSEGTKLTEVVARLSDVIVALYREAEAYERVQE